MDKIYLKNPSKIQKEQKRKSEHSSNTIKSSNQKTISIDKQVRSSHIEKKKNEESTQSIRRFIRDEEEKKIYETLSDSESD